MTKGAKKMRAAYRKKSAMDFSNYLIKHDGFDGVVKADMSFYERMDFISCYCQFVKNSRRNTHGLSILDFTLEEVITRSAALGKKMDEWEKILNTLKP